MLAASVTSRCAAVAMVAAVFLYADTAAQDKPRIAVVAFENNSSFNYWGDRLGPAVADELATQLVKAGQFTVIERQRVDAVLEEQAAGMSGAINPATAARVGKILGVQAILLGSVTKFSVDEKSGGIGRLSASYTEAESSLDVRLVDTTTGEIIAVAEGTGKTRFGGAAFKDINLRQNFQQGAAQEAVRPAVEKVVAAIVKQRSAITASAPEAAAQIVGVRDGSIYIDRGESFGIKVGQRFDVMRIVDVIKDSNGNVLDEVTEKVAVIQVTRVLSQSAICSVVEGAPQEGDRVKL